MKSMSPAIGKYYWLKSISLDYKICFQKQIFSFEVFHNFDGNIYTCLLYTSANFSNDIFYRIHKFIHQELFLPSYVFLANLYPWSFTFFSYF